jgi:hypothetical protein
LTGILTKRFTDVSTDKCKKRMHRRDMYVEQYNSHTKRRAEIEDAGYVVLTAVIMKNTVSRM